MLKTFHNINIYSSVNTFCHSAETVSYFEFVSSFMSIISHPMYINLLTLCIENLQSYTLVCKQFEIYMYDLFCIPWSMKIADKLSDLHNCH